jgi:cytochrome c556
LSLQKLKTLTNFVDPNDTIKLTVSALKQRFVDAKIDFQQSAIHFGSQSFDSAHIRNQLTILSKRLQEAVGMIAPAQPERTNAAKLKLFSDMKQHLVEERRIIAQRRQVIDERKQKAEEEEQRRVCTEEICWHLHSY